MTAIREFGSGREINIPQLEEVLKKMLADKPSDRYQSADEVLQALQLQTIASPQNSTSLKCVLSLCRTQI
jgi:serine/threonine protein kinase